MQSRERIRWVNAPEPDATQLAGKLLYIFQTLLGDTPLLKDRLVRIERVSDVQRKRGPLVIETYAVDLPDGTKSEVLERYPPPK